MTLLLVLIVSTTRHVSLTSHPSFTKKARIPLCNHPILASISTSIEFQALYSKFHSKSTNDCEAAGRITWEYMLQWCILSTRVTNNRVARNIMCVPRCWTNSLTLNVWDLDRLQHQRIVSHALHAHRTFMDNAWTREFLEIWISFQLLYESMHLCAFHCEYE